MPVKITDVSIFSELQGVSDDPVNWLLANVGDKIRVELDVSVSTFAIASVDNTIRLNAKDGYLGDGWIIDTIGRFDDFKVGDTVSVDNYSANTNMDTRTIVQKLSDNEIQLDDDVSAISDNTDSAIVLISITKPITAIRYKYNFIENDDQSTFDSKVSGTEQILVHEEVDASVTTPLNMEFIGEPSYQIGSATIEGVQIISASGNVAYESQFKIIHETYITPFMLSAQITDLLDDIAPDYYFNTNCLKAIFDVEAMYEYTDPNRIQTVEVTEVKGNTGWFGENFNTGLTNYVPSAVDYTDSTGDPIDSIQISTEKTSGSFTISNPTDTPFVNNSSQIVLNICKIPSDESEYQLNGRTLAENFCFDRAIQTAGSAAVDGDNFGTAQQILTNVLVTHASASQLNIFFDIEMDQDVIDIFNESETPRYMIWVSVQDHTLAMADADKVSLKVDADEFYSNTADADMIVIQSKLLRHPENDVDTQGIVPGSIIDASVEFNTYTLGDDVLLVDVSNGVTIGAAAWTTDQSTTYDLLVLSLATNTALGPIFGGNPAFDNSAGYTGSWVLDGGIPIFTVNGPVGTGATYNGIEIKMVWSGGNNNTFGMSGGVDSVTCDVFPEDEMVGYSLAYIDLNGREDDEIILQSVTARVKIKNSSTGAEFTADEFELDMSSYEFIGDVQWFNFGTDRSFHIPAGTIRKQIAVKRRTDLDASSKYYFEISYPFFIRWEYWAKLMGVNSAFFDVDQDENGFNHFWHHYTEVTNWGIYFETEITATKNGEDQTYTSELLMTSHDWDSNSDYTPVSIKAYDPDTLVELTQGGDKYIYGYKETLIVASFERVSATPVLADCTVNIGIEVFEQGGIQGRRRMSSEWESDADTWFISLNNDGKTELTLVGDTIEARALIDFSKIPVTTSFKIAARIYEIETEATTKLTEDGDPKLTEDGTYKIIE